MIHLPHGSTPSFKLASTVNALIFSATVSMTSGLVWVSLANMMPLNLTCLAVFVLTCKPRSSRHLHFCRSLVHVQMTAFVALLTMDANRQKAGKMDWACCCTNKAFLEQVRWWAHYGSNHAPSLPGLYLLALPRVRCYDVPLN